MPSTFSHGFNSLVETLSPKWVSQQSVLDFGTVKSDTNSWSSMESLSTESKHAIYTHPLTKLSASPLSEKSLELCTENLGCETGSDSSEYFSSSFTESESPMSERSKTQKRFGLERVNPRVFPPPLTSITGEECVHVRPHRENGRLVIKAVSVPSSHNCFQAEREGGRLRLRFVKRCSVSSEEEEEDDEEKKIKRGNLGKCEGLKENGEGEMGIKGLSRCKEGGNTEMRVWEPCWVATS